MVTMMVNYRTMLSPEFREFGEKVAYIYIYFATLMLRVPT